MVDELGGISIVLCVSIIYDFLFFEVMLAHEFLVIHFDFFDLFPLLVEHHVVPFILVRDFIRIEEILARLG